MSRSCYLVGLISPEHPGSLAWRGEAAELLRAADWIPLVPRDMKHARGDGIKTAVSAKSVVARDMKDLQECDVVLWNANLFGATRQSVGSFMELGMALLLRKPVVAIADKDDHVSRKHPFLVELVSAYYTTVEGACEFLTSYYGEI